MKRALNVVLLSLLCACVGHAAPGGTVAGTVTGPNGAPFKAAFVAARSLETRITMWVLSDAHGRYSTDKLAPGRYEVWTASVGYKSTVPGRMKMTLEDGTTQALNFTLQESPVEW